MIFKERRTGELNLIVHKEEILHGIWELENSGNNPVYLSRLKQVNEEINTVSQLTNSKQVEHFRPDRIAADIGKARFVMVYGCYRRACLNWVSEAAIKAGADVALSIKGTV